jgi:YVTN family beta-propeller protein
MALIAAPMGVLTVNAIADETIGALPPAGYRIFVTNELSGDLTVIDGDRNAVIETIPLGKRPRGIQDARDGRHLYVALSGSPIAAPGVDESSLPPADRTADGIGVLDLMSGKVVRIIKGISDPEQLAVSRNGKRLYVASEDSSAVLVFNAADGQVLETVPVGGEPEGVAIRPDGREVYVASERDHAVAVLDVTGGGASGARAPPPGRIPVGSRPRSIVFSRDGSRAYVSNEADASISVIDARNRRVLETIHIPGENIRPMGLALAPDGKRLFVTTGRGGTVVAVDTATNALVGSAVVGARPWGIAVRPDGKFLYTANGPSDDVTVVEAETLRVVSKIKAGSRPWGILAIGTPGRSSG